MNWKRFFAAVFALLVVLSFGSTRLAAQTATSGDIAGTVTDPSGATVPGAKVGLKDETKGNTQESTTNKDGVYHFYLLSPGPYTVTVSAPGFETFTRHSNVAVGQIATLNVQMTLGAATTSVTVTEAAPLLQTDNGDTSNSLSQQQVSNVPNPGNDLSAIAQLSPGIIVNSQGGYGNVEAFGLPATSNLFTVNGMDDNDPFLNLNNSGASNLLLGSNEIQEADVVTNGYSTSYGTFSGVDVNYVTKSGGNSFHGNAAYYWDGRAMNANSWLHNDNGQPRPFVNANQWAASMGGPIKKDKLFFFINNEGLRVLIPVPQTIFVPSPAFEGSVVENLTNLGLTPSIPYYCQTMTVTAQDGKSFTCPSALPGSGNGIFNLYNGAHGYSNAQNTLGNGGCDNITAATGGSGVFKAFGATAPCALSLLETPVNFAPEWQLAGRLDWNIGANDRAYLRMQYDVGTQPTNTDPVNVLFNTQSYQPEYQGQFNETHSFGPTLTNQFIMAATWYSAIFKAADQSATLAAFPTTQIINDGALQGIGGINYAFPQGRNVTQIQFGDDVSKTISNHTVKFGAKFHKDYVSDHDNGAFTSGLQLPLTLADFANGGNVPNYSAAGCATVCADGTGTVMEKSFAQSQNLPVRLYEVAGYIQDDWRIKPNLTISPGLRVEHASNPTCVTLCFAQFSEPFSSIVADPTGAYNQQMQVNRRQALLQYQNLQWEPRLSFAWQPFGASGSGMLKSDLVVRGGAGIFYDIFPGIISDNMAQNPNLFNIFTIQSINPALTGGAPACSGYLSPNQTPGSNQFDCQTLANTAFNTAFLTGGNSVNFVPNPTFTQAKTYAPQVQKWSLEIQKGFGPNDSINIGYYGNHSIHQPILNNSVNANGAFPGLSGGVLTGLPATSPTAQYGIVEAVQSAGVSNYNGVIASYKHRFAGRAGGGVFQFNYTYGHALDEISNGGFNPFAAASAGGSATSILHPQNPFDLRNMYGDADYDARHSLNANYVWEVPVRKALMGHGWAPLVDGWQVSGALLYRTGFPFTVVDPSDTQNSNYGATIFPNPIAPVTSNSCNSEKNFGPKGVPCAFAAAFGGFGGIPGGSEPTFGANGLRNAFRGPSYFDTDFAFTKKTNIPHWERAQFQLGLQFFNLFNHPNFNLPVNSITNPNFGTVQSQVNPPTSILGSFLGGDASPRLIQVKAQLVF
jgi:hypothetical protein